MKKLKPTHISHALSFPTHALEAFSFPEGAHTMRFEAVDSTNNVWGFCLSSRLTGSYPKPVLLRSSWRHFVEQKGLVPEDRVVFFMERSDEANGMIGEVQGESSTKGDDLDGGKIYGLMSRILMGHSHASQFYTKLGHDGFARLTLTARQGRLATR
ncbi:hypothetical protein OIU79_020552 [Salix purpurea]|uniref:TF-B3 domain-containing protein n=1 Tax=Salix purpurea TaxID=77065 RepID=A0A9Q0WN28_SALPP|nr:hypothetical protein OIU79_020552 [Salix purpurea]